MKSAYKFMMMLIFMVIAASMTGVYGVWIFSNEKTAEEKDNVTLKISEFTWAPEEILPTDNPGENYLVLFESILNNSKGGLNSSKDTLEKAVLENLLVHSSQNVSGGNLKHLFTTSESKELDFLVKYISDTEFHLFMYEHQATISGLVGVTNIVVYKTIVVYENKEWIGQQSKVGYAKLAYFDNSSVVAIDTDTGVRGTLPKN